MEVKEPENIQTYSKHYNEKSFWKKLKGVAGKMGRKTTYYALVLFYTLQSPSVNLGNKTIICGALGYLILPLDLIPDISPCWVSPMTPPLLPPLIRPSRSALPPTSSRR